ncbi:hypothetical protein [Luteimonas sp. RC10]|uniref:hypothetical protein n=1 Tax=Luteimonas sp. RC10 TaxID=2587035 RepID=UPI0016175B6C|nr:hypothetical protein [Luteimonas sp. RC10]MBB3342629.1 hypothetical protein [Luteimonas sp. RC10]
MTRSLHTQPLLAVAAMLMAAAIALRLLLPTVPAWAPALVLLSAVLIGAVSMRRGASGCMDAPPALRRRYSRDMTVGMVSYMALLFASLLLLRTVEATALRALIALLPVAPIALLMRAMLRFIRGVDELQQRIELEAICIAAALVSFGYMTGGFLQAAQVIDVPASAAMLWVFPLVCGLYGIAKSVVARRYR